MGMKWLRSNCNWKLVAGEQNSGSRHAGEVLASCLWAICTGFFSSFSTWGRNCWYSNAISFGTPRAQFNGSWEVKCFGCHWHLGHPSKASNCFVWVLLQIKTLAAVAWYYVINPLLWGPVSSGPCLSTLENCWAKAFTPELYITGHCLETINSGAEYCTLWRKETYLEFSIVSECH